MKKAIALRWSPAWVPRGWRLESRAGGICQLNAL